VSACQFACFIATLFDRFLYGLKFLSVSRAVQQTLSGAHPEGLPGFIHPQKGLGTKNRHVIFEVPVAFLLKTQILRDVTLCRMING